MPGRPLTRSQLAEAYEDPQWRGRFLELIALVNILRECIIGKAYRPSEELNAAIVLSDAGTRVRTQLTTQEKVNAKDAHVLTLLGLVHIDPLVNIEQIDLDRLATAISSEIESGVLRFPMILGRELYDRASELFKEERDYLNHEDTLRLMDGMPQGVFQAGPYLLGPYGIHKRPYNRRMSPVTSVPLQHCADPACGIVHRVQLSTSIDAGVNRSRPALTKVLDQISDEPSEWNGFVSDITEHDFNEYAVEDSATIEYLLGDGFSDSELASLVIHAASTTKGELQNHARKFGIQGKPKDFTVGLNRSQLLQLLFMFEDTALADLIDSSLREGVILVPADEVRRPRVNAHARSGAWRLRSQLSRLGVRAVGNDRDLPLLRLSTLARSLFDSTSPEDMDELAWILRSTRGDTPSEQLEEFLRTSAPGEVITTLVLARKSNASRVASELGIPVEQDDGSLRDSMLWKLGFPLPRSRDIRDGYWQLHNELESLAKTAAVDLSSTAEGLRSASSNYFVALEQFLFDSLAFATWALLADHYANEAPFVFLEHQARSFTIEALNASVKEEEDINALSDEPVLSDVVAGFTRLSKLLTSVRTNGENFLRSDHELPKFSKRTQLQHFPFLHKHPFLDLTAESQVNLINSLASVGSDLNASGIMTARNGLLHSKQTIPTVGEVEEALRRAREALDRLESIGCVRSTFAVTTSLTNAWGRGTTTLVSNGRTISFSSPSAYEWTKLPSLNRPHYLMQGAVFAAPNEMLRFSEGFSSEYQSYWTSYPHRAEPGNRVVSSQSETLAASVETSSYSASRVG